MPLSTAIANSAWVLSCVPAHRAFRAALGRVEETQAAYLSALLERNAGTDYGRNRGFEGLHGPDAYRHHVPTSEYEDYAPYIERISSGRRAVLTADDVMLFEPTSGTTSGTKFIPYTRSLRAEFQRAISPWVASLFARRSGLLGSLSYWSISPAGAVPDRLGSVRVGFDDDAEYLSGFGRWALGRVAAVPTSVAREPDMDSFRRRTLAHLVCARDLGLVSVWNPTFLTLLLEFFIERADDVLDEIACRDRARADAVAGLMAARTGPDVFARIWPRLELVSCWTDGPCAPYAEQIRSYLPGVEIQGKGLLSTEAFVSFPYEPATDPVLAVTSHFFEFEEVPGEPTLLAHEVEPGGSYSVIVTTGGGLYRYRLHDRVHVTGRVGQAPTMRFAGKDNLVVDLFGEKLAAAHVARSIDHVLTSGGVAAAFVMLAPDARGPDGTCYTLYLMPADREAPVLAGSAASRISDELDGLLRENFHYDYCRRLGQLGPLRLFLIDDAGDGPAQVFAAEAIRRGARLGDVKPSVLDGKAGWSERFSGSYVERI